MEHDDAKKGNVISVEGKKLAVGSTALNVFLTAIKFSLYLITGSSALLAETVHSLTDVIGSFLVVGGLYLSEKKSEQFPWGLYKVENVVAVLLSGMIFLSAYEIAKVIYQPSPHEMRNLDISLVILFLMTFPIILFSWYEAKKAKAINFPSLMADAAHFPRSRASPYPPAQLSELASVLFNPALVPCQLWPQYWRRDLGMCESMQPACWCQKQPRTSMMAFHRGSTMSRLPGSAATCKRNR